MQVIAQNPIYYATIYNKHGLTYIIIISAPVGHKVTFLLSPPSTNISFTTLCAWGPLLPSLPHALQSFTGPTS